MGWSHSVRINWGENKNVDNSGFFKERESRETRGGLQLERRLLPL